MSEVLHGQGATKERRERGGVVTRVRSTTRGGITNSYGDEVVEPTLLDALTARGMLGGERDETERYNAGMRLRDLYYSFNVKSSSGCEEHLQFVDSKGSRTVTEDVIENQTAEDKYNEIMRAVPLKYRNVLRNVCIDDIMQEYTITIDALDALHGALVYIYKKNLTQDSE